MTGRSPVAARMGRFSSPLPADIVTAPEVLRTRGYYTGVCGRYFHLDGVTITYRRTTEQVYEHIPHAHLERSRGFPERLFAGAHATALRPVSRAGAKGAPVVLLDQLQRSASSVGPGHRKVDPAKIKVPPHLPDLPACARTWPATAAKSSAPIARSRTPWRCCGNTVRKPIRWSSSWATTAWRFRTERVAVRSGFECSADGPLAGPHQAGRHPYADFRRGPRRHLHGCWRSRAAQGSVRHAAFIHC